MPNTRVSLPLSAASERQLLQLTGKLQDEPLLLRRPHKDCRASAEARAAS